MGLKQNIRGSQGEKLAKGGIETIAVTQKKVQQKYRDIACKAKFFPPYLRQAAKIYVATSHGVVRQETIEISEQRTAFVWLFAQEVNWCLKDCDKERLQTTVSVNLWKIFPGHPGDGFDVKNVSICTTELWDALKRFILTSLKIKVAPYPIIVSLDTLRRSKIAMFGPIFWKMEHGDPLILFHFLTACAINNRFGQKYWHIVFDPKLSRATLTVGILSNHVRHPPSLGVMLLC